MVGSYAYAVDAKGACHEQVGGCSSTAQKNTQDAPPIQFESSLANVYIFSSVFQLYVYDPLIFHNIESQQHVPYLRSSNKHLIKATKSRAKAIHTHKGDVLPSNTPSS